MPHTDHVSLERATQLLKQLLAARSPELGARLKQRLNASLKEQGEPPFDERALGHKSFQVFLEKTQSDWLRIARPTDGPGDISVSPRADSTDLHTPQPGPLPEFRNEVWQAFTNPDPMRKRYLHRTTGHILHFKTGDGSKEEVQYSAAQGEYAEVEFIDGQRQRDWMGEFLNAVPVVGDERQAYESMMSAPYSSAMNAAFTRALGDKHDGWKEFRTSRVVAAILSWATKHGVGIELLERERARPEQPQIQRIQQPVSKEVQGAARHDAQKLLDLLTDQEIRSVVIPVLLSTMLLRSR